MKLRHALRLIGMRDQGAQLADLIDAPLSPALPARRATASGGWPS
jgi:hypothetical protein